MPPLLHTHTEENNVMAGTASPGEMDVHLL